MILCTIILGSMQRKVKMEIGVAREALAHCNGDFILTAGTVGKHQDCLAIASDGKVGSRTELVAQRFQKATLVGPGGREHKGRATRNGGFVITGAAWRARVPSASAPRICPDIATNVSAPFSRSVRLRKSFTI
jgi:hypothetical protein